MFTRAEPQTAANESPLALLSGKLPMSFWTLLTVGNQLSLHSSNQSEFLKET